jgi:hypothetical protein
VRDLAMTITAAAATRSVRRSGGCGGAKTALLSYFAAGPCYRLGRPAIYYATASMPAVTPIRSAASSASRRCR